MTRLELKIVRRAIRTLSEKNVPFELAIVLVLQHMRASGIPITDQNLSAAFGVPAESHV